MQLSVRGKLLLIMTCIIFVVLGVHSYLQVNLQRHAFDDELAQRTQLLQENLHQRAIAQAETLKHLIAEYVAAYKLFDLSSIAKQAAEETKDLYKVLIIDNQNQVYIDTSRPDYSGYYIEATETVSSKERLNELKLPEDYQLRIINLENIEAFEYKLPIMIGQTIWGHLLLVYSLTDLNQQIELSHEEHNAMQSELNIRTLIITLTLLFIAYLFIYKISQRMIDPILLLTRSTKNLAQGDFSGIDSINSSRTDEIGLLTRHFVSMAKNLEQSYKDLEASNQTLEQKVEQRTYALNLNNSALKKALSDLEDSQQQLIHSEKMAALGQLISGIAHEINTPLGAIQASAGNNSKSYRNFEHHLETYLNNATEEDKHLLILLLKLSITKIESEIIFSTREERQQKKAIQTYLQDHQIPNENHLAELLLDMILLEDLDTLEPYLHTQHLEQIVELAHDLSSLERNNHTIQTAINKASKVVFSLKSFSHHDLTGNKILSNVNYGIQTVLVLYQNFLKQGCTVIEEFGEIPELLCYPDELNQVWTNLIHNALYAMQNVGTLTIETKFENQHIIVNITDSGCGIPSDIQNRVFDSFFTTKPAGEGSGLGLGICKRIIDKHKGHIRLNSIPGKTTFTVSLPVMTE